MTASTSPSSTKSPTTFVQADTTTFRDLVQKLTGSTASHHHHHQQTTTANPPPTAPRRSQFKLQERRHVSTKKLEIIMKSLNSLHHDNSSLSQQHSPMDLSPVTPLVTELSLAGPSSGVGSPVPEEEEKGVSEKGFYLMNQYYYSPVNTPKGSEPPELLPLFPLTSPRT